MDKSTRAVEAYTKIQTLGGRLKSSPHSYKNIRGLEIRAERLLQQKEVEFLSKPTKTLGYQILKAKGQRVKENVNDYRGNGRSVINRAKHEAVSDITKPEQRTGIYTPAETYKRVEKRDVSTTGGTTVHYETFETIVSDVDGETALAIAARMLARYGMRFKRAWLTLGGIIKPYFNKEGIQLTPKSIRFVSGVQAQPASAAVAAYRPNEQRFEIVRVIRATFKK